MNGEDDGFLQRWARRKARVQSGLPEPAATGAASPPAPATVVAPTAPAALAPQPQAVPAPVEEPVPRPTMDDVANLTRSSDYSRFVGAGVDADVSNAAMKKLFSDPHFNVMDGLDTYIDDYGKPDPIPDSMLRQLNQARVLRLFDAEDQAEASGGGAPGRPTAPAAATAASPDGASPLAVAQSLEGVEPPPESVSIPRPDDDPDLRLQQDDVPGRTGIAPGSRA
jgi:hypothetical protein